MRRTSVILLLLIVVLAAFALRATRIDSQSLWYDEAFSVYLAHFNLADITARTAADIQPPLYYYLLHFWILGAGDGELAVRYLSLFFGVLTIPLLYVTARCLFDRAAGVLASIVAALSPLYLWYSQEARMYTLITFLLLLSSYLLLRVLSTTAEGAGRGSVWLWVGFAAANIAAVYTHYFAFAVIAFQFLFALGYLLYVRRLARQSLVRLAVSFAAIVVAFLPWTPFVIARLGQDVSYWQGALKLDEAIRHIFMNFATGESVLESQAQWIAAAWLIVLLVVLAAWIADRAKRVSGIAFAILYLVVPLALLLFLFSRNPKFNARYLMIASPPLFLLLGAGLASCWRAAVGNWKLARLARSLLAALVLLAAGGVLAATEVYADSNAYFDPAFTKADFRGVANYISEHLAPGEAIILTSGHLFPAFDYYYHGDAPQIRMPDDPTLNTDHVLGYDSARVLNQTLAGAKGVWVVLWQDEVVDPNGFLPMLLSSRGKEQKVDASFWQVKVRHWMLPPGARFSDQPEIGTTQLANFKNKVELLGFDAASASPADQGLTFRLYWRALDALPDDYAVALRVLDAAGNLWGKLDRRPAGYNYPTTRWKKGENLFGIYTVPLVAGTPAGDYTVEVSFYTASNSSGLDVLAPSGAPIGKTVKVGPFSVLPAVRPAEYSALDIQNNISQPLGPFTLLGFQLGRDKASAGESIPLTLFWRADQAPAKDYALRVQFGTVVSDPLPLANARFPTSQWRAGEIVRGQYLVPIPAAAKDGTVNLRVALAGGQGAPTGEALDLAPFTVEKTDRLFVKPQAQYSQEANFSNLVGLVGFSLSSAGVKPGETLKVTLV